MFNVRLAGNHLYGRCEVAAHLAVAGDVFDGILIYAVLFPTRCLTNNFLAVDFIAIGITLCDLHFYVEIGILFVLIRIASMRRF